LLVAFSEYLAFGGEPIGDGIAVDAAT